MLLEPTRLRRCATHCQRRVSLQPHAPRPTREGHGSGGLPSTRRRRPRKRLSLFQTTCQKHTAGRPQRPAHIPAVSRCCSGRAAEAWMTPSPTPSCLATNKKMTTLYASGMRHYMGVGSFKASELTVANAIHLSTSSLSSMDEPVFQHTIEISATERRILDKLLWFCHDCGAPGTGRVTTHARCKDGIERLETRCCNRMSCGTILLRWALT